MWQSCYIILKSVHLLLDAPLFKIVSPLTSFINHLFCVTTLLLLFSFETRAKGGENNTDSTAKPTLTIYTYDVMATPEGLGTIWKLNFEKQCQCKVDLIAVGGSSALLRRARFDPNGADILLGVNSNDLNSALNIAQPYQGLLPPLMIDWKENRFIPYDYSWLAFIMKKPKDPTQPLPASMEELITDQSIQVVMENPKSSGFAHWMVALYGVEAQERWNTLKSHIVTITPGWSEAYGLFLKGEADAVLSYNSSPAYHIEYEKDERYQALIFTEGNYLLVETAAILKNAKQPELAQQFIDFMLSPDAQKEVALRNISFPVIRVPLPESFKQLVSPIKTIYPQAQLDLNRVRW